VARGAGPLAERLGHARRGGSGDRTAAADDVRDLPDVPLPLRGSSAAGSHRRRAVRRPVHPRPRRGENLNEHITGIGWPTARVRHERLEEAVEIIRQLFASEYVSYQGRYFQVERANLYDLPDQAPPVGIAVSGPDSIRLGADHADAMITVQPDEDLVRCFGEQGGAGTPVYGQLVVCYGRDEKAARRRARELWRWALPGWRVMAELPDPRAFDATSQHVTEDDIAALMPCGPDTGQYVEAVREYVKAGFTHVALVEVGAERQRDFIDWSARELLPAPREL
jgi:G6PDH family F420-dependent oxidoreductase